MVSIISPQGKVNHTHNEISWSFVAQLVKNPPATRETWVRSLGWEDPLEKGKAAVAAKSLQSCPTLCNPVDGSPPGSPIPGTLQARTLEWVANFLLQCMKGKVKVKLLSPTHSNPMDCSLPGSSAHGIFQARVLEWGAIAFSRERLPTPGFWPGEFH